MSPQPFETEIPIRWSDLDANAHVNNARVVTLIEEARLAAYRDWGSGAPNGARPRVVRSLQVEYIRPLFHERALTARIWITRIGTSSFTMHHELYQSGELAVTADAGVVQLTADHTRSSPLQPDLIEVLQNAYLPSGPA